MVSFSFPVSIISQQQDAAVDEEIPPPDWYVKSVPDASDHGPTHPFAQVAGVVPARFVPDEASLKLVTR
jgi:hypothetical protein